MDGQKKDSNAIGVIILGFFVIIAFATVFSEPVKSFLAKANYFTLILIYFITKSADAGSTIFQLKQVQSANQFTWTDIWFLTSLTGSYLRWIFIPIFSFWLVYLVRLDPKFKFRRRLNIKSLLEKNARIFFSVRPIVGEDLLSDASYKNHWRPMINPFNYAIEHNLFKIEGMTEKEVKEYMVKLYKKRKMVSAELMDEYVRPTLDREKSLELFKNQLGEQIWDDDHHPETKEDLFKIFKAFPRHKRALLTVLLCHYIAEGNLKKDGDSLLETYANSYYTEYLKKKKKKKEWTTKALDTHGADNMLRNIIKNYDIDVIKIPFMFHAWSHTLLISIFTNVKTITCADFIWLKPVDRNLWYVLNNVGRKTFACEAAGAFSHFQIELGQKQPMSTPDVDTAVDALESALASEGWLESSLAR